MWKYIIYMIGTFFMAIIVITGMANGYSIGTVVIRTLIAFALASLWTVLILFVLAVIKVDIENKRAEKQALLEAENEEKPQLTSEPAFDFDDY